MDSLYYIHIDPPRSFNPAWARSSWSSERAWSYIYLSICIMDRYFTYVLTRPDSLDLAGWRAAGDAACGLDYLSVCIHTYIYIWWIETPYTYLPGLTLEPCRWARCWWFSPLARLLWSCWASRATARSYSFRWGPGLYKTFFYFEASEHESIILLCPPHLHCSYYCNTIARLLWNMRPPIRPPFCVLYTIQYWGWQCRIQSSVRLQPQIESNRIAGRVCIEHIRLPA